MFLGGLESLIQESEKILESELGFKPENSRIVYHRLESWKVFLKWRNKKIRGLFFPRNLTAHILKTSLKGTLPIIIHEYFGHGSYCEFTRVGKGIVEYERKLSSIEKELVEEELEANIKIGIVGGKDKKIIKSEDPNYDLILQISPEDPLLKRYLSLKEEYKQYFEQNLLAYEGFSIWLENFLLEKLNQKDVWRKRESELKMNGFYNLYEKLKNFEVKEGALALTYKFGFPKQFDKKFLIKVLEKKLDIGDIVFLILYGSRKMYGDLDFLVVYKDNVVFPYKSFNTGDLDVMLIRKKDLIKKLYALDIEFTDPILTGEFIAGDQQEFKKLKNKLRNYKPLKGILDYLKKKSLESYKIALDYFNIGFQELGFIDRILVALSYALSYKLSSELYDKLSSVITFKELLEKNSFLEEVVEQIHLIRSGKVILTRNKVKSLLDKTRLIILNL